MKKLLTILAVFALLLAMAVPAMAAGGYPKIVDDAQVLSSFEERELEEKAEDLAEEYGIDVVIVIIDSLHGKDAQDFADDYFDYNGYGVGSEDSGVLLLYSIEHRDCYISTHEKGIDSITDYGIDQLIDTIADDLRAEEFYDAFNIYLDELDRYFEAWEAGEPIDEPVSFFDILSTVGFCLVIGLVVAWLVIFMMSRGMNTAKAQKSAQSYLSIGSYDLHTMRDIFLYSRVTKVRRQSSSNGSGGSSTHRSSSGRTHGGGGRRL